MRDSIVPSQICGVLDSRPDVRLLSLDCFDTLLWRVTHSPRDVFASLPNVTPQQRIWAEQRARGAAVVCRGRAEIGIAEIYATLLPNAGVAERDGYVARELAAEGEHCFGFAPTIRLMREAKRRGIPVIVVSDTYLDREQLASLMRAAAGEEALSLIDRIFCSSDHGVSKGEGLFRDVLDAVDVAPGMILHVGDNRAADYVAARELGIQALHLQQFSEAAQQRLRLEAAVGAVIDPTAAIPACQTHRVAVALSEPLLDDDAQALGYTTLGPVLHAFARWLEHCARALAAARPGQVHTLFLMRDGYLPLYVLEHSGGAGSALEISRFAAIASSFDSQGAIERFIETEIGGDPATLLRQLLFKPREIAAALRGLPARGRLAHLLAHLRTPQHVATILERSKMYAERLVAHVRQVAHPAPGDTVMLVGLGYNGTVQNNVESLLRQALGVEVAGRYLLLREQEKAGFDKQGFIASPDYDGNTLEALCGNVAVLEQLCSATHGPVIDYHADGSPIRGPNTVKGGQSDLRDRVQDGCIRFAREQSSPDFQPCEVPAEALHQSAVAVLARLMFLPMPRELAILERFDHDINLGSSGTVRLFDPEIASRGLRERGVFYMKSADRMYLPAELRGHGLPLSLALLTPRRFGLELLYQDFCDNVVELPLLVADGREVSNASVGAVATQDGYMTAMIPVGASRFAIGVQFGRLYEWVEVVSTYFAAASPALGEGPEGERVAALPTLEGMSKEGPFLFRCDDHASFMMVPPPPGDREMMLVVSFRPLALRAPAPGVADLASASARQMS